MVKSSPGIPTNLSPDQLPPCYVEDAGPSDLAVVAATVVGGLALAVLVPLMAFGIGAVLVLERWRAWRGRG